MRVCNLSCNGTPTAPAFRLARATVSQAIGTYPAFDIQLERTFGDTGNPQAWLGQPLELTLGSVAQPATFKGVVSQLRIGKQFVAMRGFGNGARLDGAPGREAYHDQTPDQAIRETFAPFAKDVPHLCTAAANAPKIPFQCRFDETPWSFARRQCALFGRLLFDDGLRVVVSAKPDAANNPIVLTSADFPAGVGEVVLTAAPQTAKGVGQQLAPFRRVTVENPAARSASAASDAGQRMFGRAGGLLALPAWIGPDAAHDHLESHARRSSAHAVIHEMETTNPHVRVGSVVQLAGPGLGGETLYVVSATATASKDDYRCWFAAVPLAAATTDLLAPPVPPRLTTAKVIDNRDPQKLGRVRLQLAWSSEKTPWALVASLAAGKQHGTCWIPSLEDLVLVTFLEEDFGSPVVIGSLYHASAQPANTGPADILLARTPRGTEVRLCDDPDQEIVTIRLPDGKTEARFAGGKNPGITLRTEGFFKIEAESFEVATKKAQSFTGESMSIVAQKQAELAGQESVSITGAEVDLNAKNQAKIGAGSLLEAKAGLITLN